MLESNYTINKLLELNQKIIIQEKLNIINNTLTKINNTNSNY